ncbi:hypothetical protein DM01DRAFT_1303553 [Hesseltinella vesiculosa]|uniref:Calcium-channel protein CCH1 n=1 Tax=Hesseltinella vesiculosa TaxID=101127 RepID=A0A1X2GKL0_9FUNG|nr:hypothetical protein DM01DRAFT_1303553 [Hesseltinella vesiculosa]
MGSLNDGIDPVPVDQNPPRLIPMIPQITLTQADNDHPLSPEQLDNDKPTPAPKRLRPRPPPLNISLAETATPLPLTRDLLRRKNKLDHLSHAETTPTSVTPQQRIASWRQLPPSSTSSANPIPPPWADSSPSQPQQTLAPASHLSSHPTSPCSSNASVSIDHESFASSPPLSPWLPPPPPPFIPPLSPNHVMNLPDHGKYQPTTHPSKKARNPSLATPYSLDSSTAPLSDHRHLPPRSHRHRSYPSLTHRCILWWLDAASRVVHTRASESTAMARLDTHDLLLQASLVTPSPDLQQPHQKISKPNEKPNPAHPGPSVQHTPTSQALRLVDTCLLQGTSLKLFGPRHRLRYWLWQHVVQSRTFELFMLMILLLHWLLLATHPIFDPEDKTVFHGHWHEYMHLAIQILYTGEALVKIIVYGLWVSPSNSKPGYQQLIRSITDSFARPWRKLRQLSSSSNDPSSPVPTPLTHKAYLHSFGNGLDLISVVCYWVDLALMINDYPYSSVFKAMGAARPLRLLSILPGTAVILESLETGWDLMLEVSGFLFFFLFIFAVVGLATFGGVYSRKCHYIPNGSSDLQVAYPTQYCSGYYNGTDILGPYDLATESNTYPGLHGHLCKSGQVCLVDTSTIPHDGYENFDTIYYAFLNVYTFVSLELWTDMMYIAQDADSRVAALYFCIGAYVIGFILVFLLLAVITSAFARVRATSTSSSAFTSSKTSRRAANMKRLHILQLLYPPDDDVHHPPRDQHLHVSSSSTSAASSQISSDRHPFASLMHDSHTKKTVRQLMHWKQRVVQVVGSQAFFYFGGFLVFVDGLFMCLRSVYASESMLEFLDNVETGFTFIFAIEIVVRMVGTSHWLDFWLSTRNRIDLALVIVTCVIQLPDIQDSQLYMYLTLFQVFRQYRLFLCIPRLEKLLFVALGTGESVMNVLVFLLLSTALFAPIFMQLFGGDFINIMSENDTSLRFDTFWQSFVTLIMIYTSETWTGTLYDTMKSQTKGGSVYAALATCLYFYYARYIMSGLYVAVILENFELDDDYIRHYQIKHFIRERMQLTKSSGQSVYDNLVERFVRGTHLLNPTTQPVSKDIQISRLPTHLTAGLSKDEINRLMSSPKLPPSALYDDKEHQMHLLHRDTTLIDLDNDDMHPAKPTSSSSTRVSDAVPAKPKSPHIIPKKLSRFIGNVLFPETDDIHISKLNQGITQGSKALDEEDYDMVVAEENKRAMQEDTAKRTPVRSLFLFSESNVVRRYCKRLVGSCKDGKSERQNMFNWVMMCCVLLSILVVILDEPSTRKLQDISSQRSEIFDTVDMALGAVFVVEMVIRIIADGLLFTPRAYLRHAWNRLDFVVILLNFGTLFANNDQLPRALGTVRSMRILRLIRYFGGMRDVFIDLFHAFPLMMDAMLLTFLVMIPFSIYGVNIFGGRFWMCNDDSALGRDGCINEFVLNVSHDDNVDLPILLPRTWQNPVMNLYSYDSFPYALRHLFSLTSTEGWVDSMFYAMSTPSENDMQPSFSWQSPYVYHSIYYVTFMIISHGTVQLFVGVIMEKFKQRSGITTLTFAQRQYVDLLRQLAEVKPTMKPIRPTHWLRSFCFDIAATHRILFNQFMMGVIVLAMVLLSTEFYDEPNWLLQLQDYFYLAIALLFVFEALIKLLGLGWKKCWQSKWNVYDACIAVSAMALTIARFLSPQLWSIRVERYCLIFAAFRLGEGIDALQSLYQTLFTAMPSIIRVSAVFMLVMCLFAMIFMEFFGLTKYGHLGSDNVNFRSYGNTLLLLVRMTTGEGWNEIMMDYTYEYPNCVASDNYLDTDCGSANWAYFMFNFFYIICTHIFLNLFVAVILSNFEYTYETRSRFTLISKDDLRNFKMAWSEIDQKATGHIQKQDLARFFKHLKGRFQVSIYEPVCSIQHLKMLSQIPEGQPVPHGTGHQSTPVPTATNEVTPLPSFLPSRPSSILKVDSSLPCHEDYFNFRLLNDTLGTVNAVELEKRRKYYNLLYMEILDSASSKGLAFSEVLRIMAFRFVNVEEALTLHPLLERLEKLDQLNKAYAAEKARGVFLTLIQRKRYLRQLWHKRNEEEIERLAMASDIPLPLSGRLDIKLSPVPKITVESVVEDDGPSSSPVGDTLGLHLELKDEDQLSIPSVAAALGTPHPDFDDGYALYSGLTPSHGFQSGSPNSLSPLALSLVSNSAGTSPTSTGPRHVLHQYGPSSQPAPSLRHPIPPKLTLSTSTQSTLSSSPNDTSRVSSPGGPILSPMDSPLPSPILSPIPPSQMWLMYDANAQLSSEQVQQVLSSMNESHWSQMLQQHIASPPSTSSTS